MSLLCDFEVPLKNQFLLVLLERLCFLLLFWFLMLFLLAKTGHLLSLSDKDLMSLLVSSSLFLLGNFKKSLGILVGFLEPGSRSLCCCKFILFSSSILLFVFKFLFSFEPLFFLCEYGFHSFYCRSNIAFSIAALSLLQCPECVGFEYK